jgi:hypothetical protein
MAIPYFLDKPESNQGIIRQVIFPKFRGINKFLYQKSGDKMIYKEIAASSNEEVVQFNADETLKSEAVINAVAIPDLTLVTQIFHDLIEECLATIGLSEYIIAENPLFKDLLKLPNLTPYVFVANPPDEFCVEKLMLVIFQNYALIVPTSAPSFLPFSPVFIENNPLKLSNPPTITTNSESEYNKYLNLLSFEKGIFTIEEYALFDEDRLALAFSYAFYYTLKDVFSSSYLQINLPPPVTPPVNQLGLNILEEITLDLKNLPIQIADPLQLPEVLNKLQTAIDEKTLLANPVNTEIIVNPDFKMTRKLKSSEEELKGKLRNIHNYVNNPDNIPVIQMEGDENGN